MLSSLLILMQAAAAQPAPAPPRSEIVVTGVKLSTLKSDLDRCIAEKCPPRADIIASVRYAEGLFRTGSYVEAKRVLTRSVGRNKGAAKADPLAVSELYLAQATVAQHEGDRQLAQEAAYRRVQVLRDAPGADDTALLTAEMALADTVLKSGDPWKAGRLYRELAARVREKPRLAAAVALRRATLAQANRRYGEARDLLAPIAAAEGEALAGYRVAARVLAARIAREQGDARAVDRALATLSSEPQKVPVLLWAPPYDVPTDPAGLDFFQFTDRIQRSGTIIPLSWVDIGFWVRSDGRVEDVEILRGSRAQNWAESVRKSVSGRRYAPVGETAGGLYRVERFTLTADYATPTGSLQRVRIRDPRIEQLDITTGAPPPPPDVPGDRGASPA